MKEGAQRKVMWATGDEWEKKTAKATDQFPSYNLRGSLVYNISEKDAPAPKLGLYNPKNGVFIADIIRWRSPPRTRRFTINFYVFLPSID